jgi:hypothetical protein
MALLTRLRAWLAGLGVSMAGGTLVVGAGAGLPPVVLAMAPLGIAGAVLLMLSPNLAFLSTAFIVPIERLGRLTEDSSAYTISLMRIVGTLALGSFLLHALVKRQRIHFGTALWMYALYFGIALTGLFHSTHMLGTVRAIGALLGNLMFFFLVVNLARHAKLARWAVIAWLLSTLTMGVYTVVNWHFGETVSYADVGESESRFSTVMSDDSEAEAIDVVARATGPTSHSAVYGMNLILAIAPLFWAIGASRLPWLKLFWLAGLGLVFYNVLLTNTRAVMLLAGLTAVACGMVNLYRIRLSGVMVGLVVAAALLPLVPDSIWTRVLDWDNYSLERSATLRIRFEYWDAGLRVFADHWLTGVGVGNQLMIPKYLTVTGPQETTVHMEYLMTAMEVGLFGWLLFFGFVGLVFAAAWRARRLVMLPSSGASVAFVSPALFTAIMVSMAATLAFGVQVDVFHFPLKGWWLLAGIAWAQYRVMLEAQEASRNV